MFLLASEGAQVCSYSTALTHNWNPEMKKTHVCDSQVQVENTAYPAPPTVGVIQHYE